MAPADPPPPRGFTGAEREEEVQQTAACVHPEGVTGRDGPDRPEQGGPATCPQESADCHQQRDEQESLRPLRTSVREDVAKGQSSCPQPEHQQSEAHLQHGAQQLPSRASRYIAGTSPLELLLELGEVVVVAQTVAQPAPSRPSHPVVEGLVLQQQFDELGERLLVIGLNQKARLLVDDDARRAGRPPGHAGNTMAHRLDDPHAVVLLRGWINVDGRVGVEPAEIRVRDEPGEDDPVQDPQFLCQRPDRGGVSGGRPGDHEDGPGDGTNGADGEVEALLRVVAVGEQDVRTPNAKPSELNRAGTQPGAVQLRRRNGVGSRRRWHHASSVDVSEH